MSYYVIILDVVIYELLPAKFPPGRDLDSAQLYNTDNDNGDNNSDNDDDKRILAPTDTSN